MSEISIFHHEAMTTSWEIRIAGEDPTYAGQAARQAFQWADRLEGLLSRFREESEISLISRLPDHGRIRLSRPVFDFLELSRECEAVTGGAFSLSATALREGRVMPVWRLEPERVEMVVESGPCCLDPGAIGKGFALDRMGEELVDWGVASFLLSSGGSSILAGDPPADLPGWKIGIGDGNGGKEYYLTRAGIGASGFSVKGHHISDPVSGRIGGLYERTWALAPLASLADAYSTAWMNLSRDRIRMICESNPGTGAAILDPAQGMDYFGRISELPEVPRICP